MEELRSLQNATHYRSISSAAWVSEIALVLELPLFNYFNSKDALTLDILVGSTPTFILCVEGNLLGVILPWSLDEL